MLFPQKGDAAAAPKTIRKPLPMPNNLKSCGAFVSLQTIRTSDPLDHPFGRIPPSAAAEFHASVNKESEGKTTSASQSDGNRTLTALS